jgi:hypothetical protein
MNKIVVINSSGPMASSLVAAIVEKFGYLNIPLRKIGFHDYLIGDRELSDPYIWTRMIEVAKDYGQRGRSGGVSVVDRDKGPLKRLIDSEGMIKELEILERKNYSEVSALYQAARNCYAENLLYKGRTYDPKKNIELTTDIQKFNPQKLLNSYQDEFDKVYMIHMHRDFTDWVESLVSQRFNHPRFRTKYLFLLSSAYRQFNEYEKMVNQYPGIHINIKSLFLNNTSVTIEKIAQYIDEPLDGIIWPSEEYDLFGKLSNYNAAFTPSDYSGRYLSRSTLILIKFFEDRSFINRFTDIIVAIMYLLDKYKFNNEK